MQTFKSHSKIVSILFLTAAALAPGMAFSAETTEADNSKVNARIEEKNQLTAQDQGNSTADVEVTRKIRQEVVKRDSFSTDAKNVKIITRNGVVTLKGPVSSATEKTEIEKIATTVAGRTKVVNQISVVK